MINMPPIQIVDSCGSCSNGRALALLLSVCGINFNKLASDTTSPLNGLNAMAAPITNAVGIVRRRSQIRRRTLATTFTLNPSSRTGSEPNRDSSFKILFVF